MDMVKLSIMGWGDHPELGSWPSGVMKGLKICYTERPVIPITSVTVPRVVLPLCLSPWCCLSVWGGMRQGDAETSVFFMPCVYVCLCVCACVCS